MVEHNRLLVEVGQNLYKSVNDQSNILHEVCTNISSQLEQQKQTIDVIGVNICNHLVQQSQSMADIGTKLGHTMVEQNNLLTEMGRSIGNSVGQQLVNELNAAMEGLIAGVSESIHDNMMHASEHLKQSAEMLDVSAENLTSATGKIDSVTKTLPVTIDAMSNVIGDVQELLESVNESTAELTTKHEAIVETLGNIGDSAIQLNEVIDTVNRAIANINEVIRNINIPQIIQAQKDQYNQVENLVTAQHKQISSLTGQQLDILNNIEDLRVCIEKLYESIGAVTNIKKDVKDIFEAINAGLQDHVNLLHNQTTGLLTTYTDKFTSATESINNTVGNLTESFDSAANTMFVSVSESAKKIEEATALIAKNK
jgi:ABC-type transporter Mla subunit MlaD